MTYAVFRKTILEFYTNHGRVLPWRDTQNPYHIWVSEIMLQQTQVSRVIPKYKVFIQKFPTIEKLARATPLVVLRLWQGLGYNRRALLLHKAAQEIVKKYKGVFPKDIHILETLPGIGHYTAGAITTFAYNMPNVFIETNIRAVYIHFFCKEIEKVSDDMLLPIIEKTMYVKNPRLWYSALMDYGTLLKQQGLGKNERSLHHIKQKSFKGSNREVRGAIVKLLVEKKKLSQKDILQLPFTKEKILKNFEDLKKEGFVK